MIYFSGEIGNETKELLEKLLNEAFIQNNQDASLIELEFSLIESQEMLELNTRTRGIEYATDVLSFPALEGCLKNKINKKNYPFDINMENGLIYFGEIVINQDRAKEQAQEYGHSYNRELCYLFVHGVMHLLGYDHENEEDKKLMREQEEKVLTKYNITREK
ncbi:MAG: rRNA maturation RNase YbeY [Clostridia bacterium]|nr:rRNA maturation RNase YbeY [Clostridia bacterium]